LQRCLLHTAASRSAYPGIYRPEARAYSIQHSSALSKVTREVEPAQIHYVVSYSKDHEYLKPHVLITQAE
jgi:hypothetical protein